MLNQKDMKISAEVLLQYREDLEKLRNDQDYRNIVNILKMLNSLNMTRELLQKTLIGRTLTVLSKMKVKEQE